MPGTFVRLISVLTVAPAALTTLRLPPGVPCSVVLKACCKPPIPASSPLR